MSNNGGLSGLLGKFTQNGLGQQVQSWVGNGANMPITADHVNQVLGNSQIQELAQKLGVDPSKASGIIASVLPNMVDKLTPNGQQVSDAEAQQGLSGILSKGLGGLNLGSLFGGKS